MKNTIKTKSAQRAISGILSIALVSAGVGVTTVTPAFATETCAEQIAVEDSVGNLPGKLEIVGGATKNFKAGDVVTVKGSGFDARPGGYLSLKIDKGQKELWKKSDQKKGSDLGTNGNLEISNALEVPNEMIVNGSFEVKVVLPAGLKDGKHRFSILGGHDGNVSGSDDRGKGSLSVDLFINNSDKNDGHCGSLKVEDGNTPGNSSDGEEGFPVWATALLSVLAGLGVLGALAALLPRVLGNAGIRLPF